MSPAVQPGDPTGAAGPLGCGVQSVHDGNNESVYSSRAKFWSKVFND